MCNLERNQPGLGMSWAFHETPRERSVVNNTAEVHRSVVNNTAEMHRSVVNTPAELHFSSGRERQSFSGHTADDLERLLDARLVDRIPGDSVDLET